jgi:hypothetical protein
MMRLLSGLLSILAMAGVATAFKAAELLSRKNATVLDAATFFGAVVIALLVGALVWEASRVFAPEKRT